MNFYHLTRRVSLLAPLALLAVSLTAQTQKTLTGSYILAEVGTSNNGPVTAMAQLSFSDNGVVTGTEILRTQASARTFPVSGNYVFDGPNFGTLALYSTTTDGEDVQTTAMSYRFVMSASQIQAIRSNSDSITTATLLPATAGFSGSFAYSDLQEEISGARVVAFTVDTAGAVSGSAIVRSSENVSQNAVTGAYSIGENGIGLLTFIATATDIDGNDITRSESFAVASAKDRAILMRLAGTVELIQLSR